MKSNNQMYEQIVMVTPEMAKDMLARSKATGFRNRNLDEKYIQSYSSDMLGGRWAYNGDLTCVGVNGAILDGQHRLHAIIRAGVSIRMRIAYNYPIALLPTINSGKPRKPANYLTMTGHKNAGAIASVVRSIYGYHQHGVLGNYGRTLVSASSVARFVDRYPDAAELARRYSSRTYTGMFIQPNVSASLIWLLQQNLRSQAEVFFDRVATSTDLVRGMPELALRNALQSIKMNRGKKDNYRAAAVAVVGCWNHFAQSSSRSEFRISEKILLAENFPSIYGADTQLIQIIS